MQLKDMAIGAEVVRVAPLGDPIEIRIRGCLITVRKDEAEILDIDPIG